MPPKSAVAAVLLSVLVAGCLAGPLVTSDETEPLPEKPDTLTEETVSNYTTTYERTTIYNRHVDDNPTENRITCRSDSRVALESAFVVHVQCTGGVRLAGGILESESHSDVAASADYYVSNDTVIRLDADDWRTETYQGSGPDRTSFGVVNLANESTAVDVELERDDSPLQFDYTIDPRSGVYQSGLPFEHDSTREMRIRTDDASTTAEFTSERIEFGLPTIVYVLPDGQVRVTVGPSEL